MSETRTLCYECLGAGQFQFRIPVNAPCDLCGHMPYVATYSANFEVDLDGLPPDMLIKILTKESEREFLRQLSCSFSDWLDRQQCLP